MFVIQLSLQSFQQTPLLAETPLTLVHPLPTGGSSIRGDHRPQLPLPPQRSADLQGFGSLGLQLDLELLEASLEAEGLLLPLLGEPRGGLALLIQGQGQLSHAALLLPQSQLQVLTGKRKMLVFKKQLTVTMLNVFSFSCFVNHHNNIILWTLLLQRPVF